MLWLQVNLPREREQSDLRDQAALENQRRSDRRPLSDFHQKKLSGVSI